MKIASEMRAVRRIFFAALLWATLAPLGTAHAQYVCMPGTHSTTGAWEVPNASFCAPDESQGDDRESRGTNDASPPPEPVWETRWGAIATGEGSFGTAVSYPSEQAARSRATLECQAQSNGKPCRVKLAFYNQCAALAGGDTGSIAFGSATEERAKNLAVTNCSKHTSNCRVIYSGCSLPELSR